MNDLFSDLQLAEHVLDVAFPEAKDPNLADRIAEIRAEEKRKGSTDEQAEVSVRRVMSILQEFSGEFSKANEDILNQEEILSLDEIAERRDAAESGELNQALDDAFNESGWQPLGIISQHTFGNVFSSNSIKKIKNIMYRWMDGRLTMADRAIRVVESSEKSHSAVKAFLREYLEGKNESALIHLEQVDGDTANAARQLAKLINDIRKTRINMGLDGGLNVDQLLESKRPKAFFDPEWKLTRENIAEFFNSLVKEGKVENSPEGLEQAKRLAMEYLGKYKKGIDDIPAYAMPLLGGAEGNLSSSLYSYVRNYISRSSSEIELDQLSKKTGLISNTHRRGYVKIETPNRIFGEYEGMYIPASLASDMGIIGDKRHANEFVSAYMMAHSWFKSMKILWSTTSYPHNFFGNFFLSQLQGVPMWWQIQNYRTAAREVIGWIRTGKASLRLENAIMDGVFSGTMSKEEVSFITNDLEKIANATDFKGMTKQLYKLMAKMEQMSEKPRAVYEAVEYIHRYLDYIFFTEHGSLEFDLKSGGVIPLGSKRLNSIDAVNRVNQTLFDYRHLPKPVKALRDSVLPFVSFPYFAANSLARAAVERPWNIARMAITASMIRMAFRAISKGITGDEEELMLDNIIPFWRRIEMGFTMGSNWLKSDTSDDAIGNVKRAIGEAGDYLFDAREATGDPLNKFRTLSPGGPAWSVVEAVTGKKSFGGFRVWDEKDDAPTKVAKSLAHIGQVMAPAMAVNYYYNLSRAAAGEKDWGKALASMFGIRYDDINAKEFKSERYWLDRHLRERLRKFKSFYEEHGEDSDAVIRYSQRMQDTILKAYKGYWDFLREEQEEWYNK